MLPSNVPSKVDGPGPMAFGSFAEKVFAFVEALENPPPLNWMGRAAFFPLIWWLRVKKLETQARQKVVGAFKWQGILLGLSHEGCLLGLLFLSRYAVRKSVQVGRDAANDEERPATERGLQVVKAVGSTLGALTVAWYVGVVVRALVRQRLLPRAAGIPLAPSVWRGVLGTFYAAFPYPRAWMRGPTLLVLRNVFDLAEVRLTLQPSDNVLTALESVIDNVGWVGLLHGVLHQWALELLTE